MTWALPALKHPRQLGREQHRLRRLHAHHLRPDVVARADLPAHLGAPVAHVPLEPARRDRCGARDGDDPDVFFQEVLFLVFVPRSGILMRLGTLTGLGGMNDVLPPLQHEGNALLGDEVDIACRFGARGMHVQVVDLREGLVDAPAETAEDDDVDAGGGWTWCPFFFCLFLILLGCFCVCGRDGRCCRCGYR